MANPRLASRAPRACAACYAQYPDRLHVDFMAAYEGGLVDPDQPRGGHVDWLIICEKCLRDAVALLPENSGPREALEKRVEALEAELKATQQFADKLEDALSHRPAERAERAPAAKPKAQRKPRYQGQGA